MYGDVPSLKLTVFRNRGFKLASFLDKDPKSACIDDVERFLDSFIAYRNSNYNKFRKEFAKGLPLRILIRKFQVKYGLYLLFDVLRYFKYLRVRDADYMFIEGYSFNKYLQI